MVTDTRVYVHICTQKIGHLPRSVASSFHIHTISRTGLFLDPKLNPVTAIFPLSTIYYTPNANPGYGSLVAVSPPRRYTLPQLQYITY
jgi:hypothetical protein